MLRFRVMRFSKYLWNGVDSYDTLTLVKCMYKSVYTHHQMICRVTDDTNAKYTID